MRMRNDAENKAAKRKEENWRETLLEVYRKDADTDRLLLVKHQGGSDAILEMYEKTEQGTEPVWRNLFSCDAYVGRDGMGKMKEGDWKTPVGTFSVPMAFGRKKNPGTRLPYTELNEYLYWSAEKETYNQMIDVRTLGRESIQGEHLIEEDPAYNYAMLIGYNEACVFGEGSAIFLHGKGKNPYTAGCVAVDEEIVVRILQNATEKMKISISR